ncbi:MAG: TrkA C-terminal domain-containing protein, partial [Verrucomicrobiota bacterium]|nr:TrkA C-terminal domain-containing protein [Verrucomicrobiota bacterium]
LLFIETALLSGSIMPSQLWARVLVGVILLLVGVFGWSRFWRLGTESLATLRGVLSEEIQAEPADAAAELLDVHTERLKIAPASEVCGQSLRGLNLRARLGVSVIGIERKGVNRVNPTADTTLEAGDLVMVLGDDEQIALVRDLLT